MEILIVTGIFPPDIGGPASYVPKIAGELVQRGDTVNIICLSDDINLDDSKYPFPVFRIKRGLPKPERWVKTIATIRKLAKSSDVIYVNGLAFETTIITMFLGKPSVHKIVGDYSWERARNRGWFNGTIDDYQKAHKSILLKITDWIRSYPLKTARDVIVPSKYLKGIVEGWGIDADKIHVVYNAVELPSNSGHEKVLPKYEGHTLITVCRLVSWKGLEELIEVLAELNSIRLVICGDGPMRNQLESMVKNIGLNNRVIFTGQVSKGEVCSYLKQSDCFVLNSSYEGLPHVVLEAMQADIPVLASDAGGTGEVVRRDVTGTLVSVGNKMELKNAILNILNDSSKTEILRQAARKMIEEEFTYKVMIDQTYRILSR